MLKLGRNGVASLFEPLIVSFWLVDFISTNLVIYHLFQSTLLRLKEMVSSTKFSIIITITHTTPNTHIKKESKVKLLLRCQTSGPSPLLLRYRTRFKELLVLTQRPLLNSVVAILRFAPLVRLVQLPIKWESPLFYDLLFDVCRPMQQK